MLDARRLKHNPRNWERQDTDMEGKYVMDTGRFFLPFWLQMKAPPVKNAARSAL